jgi:NAD(P)-dependent dehydrogenase (short-subunit alcohol dehydrogenase family)
MAIPEFTDRPLSELISLAGRRAVVTGGALGMGAGIARRLAEAGASVVIGDINMPAAEATCAQLRGPEGAAFHALSLDVAEPASISEFTEAAVARMGGLDIWVNNAGYYPRRPALEIDVEFWDKIQDVNLKGAFFAAQGAARQMIACGSTCGVIVNISSMSGLRGRKNGMSHYGAAKHGLVGLTKFLALELGDHNIRVMGIAPAATNTAGSVVTPEYYRDFPVGRAGTPDDIALAVLFCASDMSAFMTGSTLLLDGGSGAGVT